MRSIEETARFVDIFWRRVEAEPTLKTGRLPEHSSVESSNKLVIRRIALEAFRQLPHSEDVAQRINESAKLEGLTPTALLKVGKTGLFAVLQFEAKAITTDFKNDLRVIIAAIRPTPNKEPRDRGLHYLTLSDSKLHLGRTSVAKFMQTMPDDTSIAEGNPIAIAYDIFNDTVIVENNSPGIPLRNPLSQIRYAVQNDTPDASDRLPELSVYLDPDNIPDSLAKLFASAST